MMEVPTAKIIAFSEQRECVLMPEYDKWSRWLLETRFGGDEKIAELGLRLLGLVKLEGIVLRLKDATL